MPDLESYNKEQRSRVRRYAAMFRTESGKRFIKEEMIKYQVSPIDAETEWERGIQEGERRLAQVIIDLSNYEGSENE